MSFSVMQWNCRGVLSKWPEMKPVLTEQGRTIICLQETHFLATDQYDFNLYNYTLYNCFSNTDRRQGGVCIYASNDWPHFQVTLRTCLQAVACVVRIGSTRLCICCLYLPPNVPFSLNDLTTLISQLSRPFLICADANSRHYLWGSDQCDRRGTTWEQVIRSESLNVLNDGCPTRMDDYTGLWSHIDITLSTSDIGQYLTWHTSDELYSSDHCPIYVMCDIQQRTSVPPTTHHRWNLKKANWTDFAEKCDIHFDETAGESNCATMTKCIVDTARDTVPLKSGKGKYNCPWWTEDCKEAIRARKRAYNRFRRSHRTVHLMAYKQAKAKARQTIRKAKKDSWLQLLHMFTHSTPMNQLWDIIKRFTKRERFQRPLPVLKFGGNIIDDPYEVGNVLGQYYSDLSSSQHYRPSFAVHLTEMTEHMPVFTSDNTELYNSDFTMKELKAAVSLCGNTSVGPDMIHYMFFKQMTDRQLVEVLKLLNYIWDSGSYPREWRHSLILPIKKPGKSGEKPEDYRPIQLTSCFSKLMERLVAKRLTWFVEHVNLISDYQSAFRKKRCTSDHLLRLESMVRQGFFYNKYTLAVFLDLKSAYNLTSTVALLQKMYTLGFRGRLMIFLQEYLQHRTFQVKTDRLSETFDQENGLVQGGVISPILFNIMINDIFSDIPSNMHYALYADDCSMWTQGRHILPLIVKMQTALNRVCAWADKWGFLFSPTKCNAIIFRRYMNSRELEGIPTLTIYDQHVPFSDEVKFLGAILDSRLNMASHIQYVKAKAVRRMAILKCLAGKGCGADRVVLIRIYKSMIRPILDYACQLLDGPCNTIVESLECVQNACLRIATGALRTSPILPMLVEADVFPLRLRRMDLTIRYCLKVRSQDTHPCHLITTSRSALHTVDRDYMRRISGFPIYERLTAMCSELQFCMPADLSFPRCPIPPWQLRMCETVTAISGHQPHLHSAETVCEFHDFQMRYPDYDFLYTDGSKTPNGVGCSFVHGARCHRYKLPGHCTIFTAEAVAIFHALQYIERECLHKCVICTDSLSVVTVLRSTESDHPTITGIYEHAHRLLDAGHAITLAWIPGHCNIAGNEEADAQAKLAVLSGDVCAVQVGYTEYALPLRTAIRALFDRLWSGYRPGTALKSIKEVSGPWDTSTRKNRREEIVLCRLRLGHTRFTHSFLIDREPRPRCDHCQCPRSVQHLLIECPAYATERIHLFNACQRYGKPLSLRSILGNDHPENIDVVFTFLRNCQLLNLL